MIQLTTYPALRLHLARAQQQRLERLAFTIAHPLSSSFSDARLRDAMDVLLPMAQGRSIRIRRERNGDWQITLHLRYRQGVRIADAYQHSDLSRLSPDECQTLDKALSIVAAAREGAPDSRALARRLFDAVRACAVYENPPVGSPACALVISATSVLVAGRANCQGFADAYYLLATVAGLTVGYQAGYKHRIPHLWNLLLLDGRWQTVDVTSGAFLPTDEEIAALGLTTDAL